MRYSTIAFIAALSLADSTSANEPALNLTEEITGTAKVLTAGSFLVEGKVIALAYIRDLDEMPAFCHWLFGTHLPGKYPLAPSVNSVSLRTTCAKNPGGTFSRPDKHRHRCETSFTAIEQANALRKLIEGREVTCRIAAKETLEPFWNDQRAVSRFGHRLYPGACRVDGQSVTLALLKTGYATSSKNPYITLSDGENRYWPGVVDKSYRKIEQFQYEQAALRSRRSTRDQALMSTLSACTQDNYADHFPERYNPKPVLE